MIAISLAYQLRAIAVQNLPVDYDEDDYLRAAQEYAAGFQTGDFSVFLESNYRPEHPPLAKMAFGLAISALEPAPLVSDRPTTAGPASSLPQPHLEVARWSAAWMNILTVGIVAILQPFAGILLALHTFTIKYSSQVMLEALPLLTATLSVAFYQLSRGKLNFWLILSGVFLGFTAAGKYLYAVAGLAILADLILAAQPQFRLALPSLLRKVLVWGALSLVIFALVQPYLWPDILTRLSDSIFFHSEYTQTSTVQDSGLPWWQPLNWLAISVPWHPDVFPVPWDLLISILALAGLPMLWKRQRVHALWLAIGLVFLFLWPTKWPQYILTVMVPVCLSAGLALQAALERMMSFVGTIPRQIQLPIRFNSKGLFTSLPWIAPGLIMLALIFAFPLIFQLGMSLTNFSGAAIRDGLNGGVFREVWLGITGQVESAPLNLFSFNPSKEVKWTGPGLLFGVLLSQEGGSILAFEIVWTILTVFFQTCLGIALALILHQPGLRLKSLWMGLFVLPWAIPEFVGVLMWSHVLDSRFGWLVLASESYFQRIDLPFLQPAALAAWQQHPNTALAFLILPAVWSGFPFMMAAALAGLRLIPRDIYEAAQLDGANFLSQFRHLTLPMLMPLLIPAMLIRAIFAFNQFYLFQPFRLPWPLTTFASQSYYFFAQNAQYALSAAVNIVTIVFLFLLITGFLRASRSSLTPTGAQA